MENPDLPPPPIYRRIFDVPKGGGKSGFYWSDDSREKFPQQLIISIIIILFSHR